MTHALARFAALAAAALLLVACSERSATAPEAAESAAPAGEYRLDKSHASLIFRVDHAGFSKYTAKFADFDATLRFDPDDPKTMSVVATIDPASLVLDHPPEGFLATLTDEAWLGAGAHPQMTFRSTRVEVTGARTARVLGELTLKGATQPVSFEATFNGGYAGFPVYDPNGRVGFSARGSLSRSAFGVSEGLPPPGSTMGVGDLVEFEIEAEFTGPPLVDPAG